MSCLISMLQNLPVLLSGGATSPVDGAGMPVVLRSRRATGDEAPRLVLGRILDSGQDFTLQWSQGGCEASGCVTVCVKFLPKKDPARVSGDAPS